MPVENHGHAIPRALHHLSHSLRPWTGRCVLYLECKTVEDRTKDSRPWTLIGPTGKATVASQHLPQ